MIDARLPLLLESSGVALPEGGRVAVFRPPHDASLPGLSAGTTEIIEGFRPAHDGWCARGYKCTTEASGRYNASVVCLQRSKDESRALIFDAMSVSDGPLVIDGQKTDGIDSILREVRKRVPVTGPVSKAHGKLFVIPAADPDAFKDWQAGPALQPGGFWSAPGVFSADAVDPASDLLVHALPDDLGRTVVDAGAGWGYLSAHILTQPSVETVHLVEAGFMALECARRNVTDPRAEFHWADALSWRAPEKADCVVMNPPFHTTRAADPALGQAFVKAAAAMLGPQGQLFMVANRHLPYEATLGSVFSGVSEIGGDHRFKLFHAARPLRKRGR